MDFKIDFKIKTCSNNFRVLYPGEVSIILVPGAGNGDPTLGFILDNIIFF